MGCMKGNGGPRSQNCTYKRRPEAVIVGDVPLEKRRKMERSMTQQCSALLKALMKHPAAGKVFNPKVLKIPDYFTVVKNPIDLDTIKSKLAKNTYLGIEEFVADIKLTFSNAMLYYPPSNNVHKMAEEINEFLEVRWKSLEEKWNHQENLKVGDGKILSMQLKDANGSRQSCSKTQLYRNSFLPKKSKPSESEEKVVKVPLNARTQLYRNIFLPKKSKPSESEEKFVKVPLNARAVEVEVPKPVQNCVSKLARKNLQKGTSSGSGTRALGSINAKPLLSQGACKCRSCGSIKCQCSLLSDSNHASSRVVTSKRSLGGGHRVCSAAGASKLDSQAKSKLTSQMSKSYPDSNGTVSALNEENVCLSSQLTTPATVAASSERLLTAPTFDAQLSPKRLLRAAMLKRRFANTILKAQQNMLLVHGDKADPVKMQQEKEKLERRHREEISKVEAQIRAAEAVSKMKEEVQLKKQRERDREAARITLEKMENTAGIEVNLEILKELDILSGCCLYRGNPLHELGLFIKDEYLEDEDDEIVLNEDVEEGEIVC
ncbi:hypothetical protein CRYUN_Cryun41cG0041000 [Craigia yunnanensis]